MTYAFVGHRGVGKTSLMKRLKNQNKSVKWVDLDHEIEAQHGKIQDLIQEKGEAYFRTIEADVFKAMFRLYGQQKSVFVFGAGFPVENIPDSLKVIWIRRQTDSDGRVFLDRPRLDHSVSALQESIDLYQKRNQLFAERCDFFYDLPEGHIDSSATENFIFSKIGILEQGPLVEKKNFFIRVSSQYFITRNLDLLKSFDGNLEFVSQDWDLKVLLSSFQVLGWSDQVIQSSGGMGNLLSLRDHQILDLAQQQQLDLLSHFHMVDLDLSVCDRILETNILGSKKVIISSHLDNIDKAIRGLSAKDRKKFHFKLCPLVDSWDDFYKGYLWWKHDPPNRSYLPRSHDGKWQWFRQLMGNRQLLNFVSSFSEEIHDQPRLYDILSAPTEIANRFAAVLGDPIKHSRSPQFHWDFFRSAEIPFLAINVKESEFEVAINYLTQLGLRFAAVTSPLKRKVYRWLSEKSADSHTAEAVNTLSFKESSQNWIGDQTDLVGLMKCISVMMPAPKTFCIWGGGGVLEILKNVFPSGEFFPARQDAENKAKAMDLLIWASPRLPDVKMPPKEWSPKLVYDLNYIENSIGKEYAALNNLPYVSGLDFFKEQALEQQKIWKNYL